VAQIATDRGRLVIPHCWKTGIGIAASAHLSAICSNSPFIEYLPAALSESPLRKELVQDELTMIDGKIPLPQKPGLGVELNRESLERFKVD
jgi:L-alanine-DL-glutamate epimerase-like enolase superfamily enzyme